MEKPSEQARLVLGLGNPGGRYADTRHNLGFRVVDELAGRLGVRLGLDVCGARWASSDRIDLATPQTYMNRSGYSARCLSERNGYAPGSILVVYDEVHLPLGRLRLRGKGSPGGHRGMESVIENLRTTAVPRLRLGIAPDEAAAASAGRGEDLPDFVLAPFTADEMETAERMVRRAADCILSWVDRGVDVTMNEYNG
ncbi:MAG: aminoacyl-tRNA hydrolase [Acidobacteriota bacterium]|nr:aminoacyl-tRNA hydrolase [Acidobacteriota bacterium]MDE2922232.1 aminoacyl-tRNA hydrolase [Acidobacteriota bacterium]MDE3265267.1 aminoacyl-tRNA hydrolase [Acidobacteriota bacterium]